MLKLENCFSKSFQGLGWAYRKSQFVTGLFDTILVSTGTKI